MSHLIIIIIFLKLFLSYILFIYLLLNKGKHMNNIKRTRMCVYLDIELSDWIKKNAISEYRSFSSFLNKLMLDHKEKVEQNTKMNVLKSETKS